MPGAVRCVRTPHVYSTKNVEVRILNERNWRVSVAYGIAAHTRNEYKGNDGDDESH